MKNTYTLSADCYVLPYDEKGPHSYIAYFPIQSLVFEVNKDAADILQSLKTRPYNTGIFNKRFFGSPENAESPE